MVEKARALTASQAKKAEFGETGKYVNFVDKAGEKAAVSINQDTIDCDPLTNYSLSETQIKTILNYKL